MRNKKNKWQVFPASLLLTFLIFTSMFGFITACRKSVDIAPEKEDRKIIAYLAGWYGIINPDTIPVQQLTHINYAFALIGDGEIVTGHANDEENLGILKDLKERSNKLKIIISIGGWEGSGGFSDMALTKTSRSKFIESVIAFLKKYNLDGIDIDWEYPGLPGYGNTHRPEDKVNFTYLLQELRERLNQEEVVDSKGYILTIAAASFYNYLVNTEMGKIHEYLDYINPMTYDFAGEWTANTGHHTNLYIPDSHPFAMSAHTAVTFYLNKGVPKEKIILGIAFYGRGWKDVRDINNGLYQPGTGISSEFLYKTMVQEYINKNGYTRYWDESAKAPYLWNQNEKCFISYEDEESIYAKCNYIKSKELGGAMFWELHGDYQNTLLNKIYENLK